MSEAFDAAHYEDAARQALKAFPVDAADMRFVHVSENVTFRVDEHGTGRCFVLRLHRPDYHTQAVLESEHLWTRALDAAGLLVPRPVAARNGQDYVRVPVAATGEKRWAGLADWVPGEVLHDLLQANADPVARAGYYGELGGILAAAHAQASAWPIPAGFVRHHLDEDGLMGERPFWGPFWEHAVLTPGERDLLLTTRDRIRQTLVRYGKPNRTYSVIHADLQPRNVVVSDGRMAMIDFDDCAFGWHQYDLAVALFSVEGDADAGRLRDALVAGYRAVRDLDDADLALLPMFILIRGMAVIGWMHERPELGISPRLAGIRERVCAAAEAFVPPC
mgnify:CR=1 FL=1